LIAVEKDHSVKVNLLNKLSAAYEFSRPDSDLMLLVLIAIGALLIPLHRRIEKWITKKMVEKNKKLRPEAAKKTIANLEGEQKGRCRKKLAENGKYVVVRKRQVDGSWKLYRDIGASSPMGTT
jgi:hypothetical protein